MSISAVKTYHSAMSKSTLNRKGDTLPVDIKRPTKEFIDSVNQMAAPLKSLEECQLRARELTPLDSARVDLTTVYAINSLYWIYLVTKGENPRDHDVRKELDRLKEHMKRFKQLTNGGNASQQSDSSAHMKVNKQAAQRIIKHTIGRQAEARETSDPPPKRQRRQ